ncbi:MAG: PhnE/PtxC family ABC transporter permease [Planctomycetaceae bacterium]
MTERQLAIGRLRATRPRSRFLRRSLLLLAALAAYAWLAGGFRLEDAARRWANFDRFLGEVRPYPLQGREFDAGTAARWAGGLMASKGWAAAVATLAIAVAAIVLAGVGAALLSPPAARNFAAPEPFLPGPRPPPLVARWSWSALVAATRLLLIFLRAVPEYVWAFLFLAMLGPTPWVAVLALALHNLGILGKLGAETVENLEPGTLRALRGLGAGRLQIAAAGIFPAALPRFLLYFFYRWETCVREATVLGMLGIASLGALIQDARARNHHDEMFLFILAGAGLVLLGDLVSAVARAVVRRA